MSFFLTNTTSVTCFVRSYTTHVSAISFDITWPYDIISFFVILKIGFGHWFVIFTERRRVFWLWKLSKTCSTLMIHTCAYFFLLRIRLYVRSTCDCNTWLVVVVWSVCGQITHRRHIFTRRYLFFLPDPGFFRGDGCVCCLVACALWHGWRLLLLLCSHSLLSSFFWSFDLLMRCVF